MGFKVSAMPCLPHPWETTAVPAVVEAEWAQLLVWMGGEKRKSLVPSGVQSLNCTVCSESLHKLCYPGPTFTIHAVDQYYDTSR